MRIETHKGSNLASGVFFSLGKPGAFRLKVHWLVHAKMMASLQVSHLILTANAT